MGLTFSWESSLFMPTVDTEILHTYDRDFHTTTSPWTSLTFKPRKRRHCVAEHVCMCLFGCVREQCSSVMTYSPLRKAAGFMHHCSAGVLRTEPLTQTLAFLPATFSLWNSGCKCRDMCIQTQQLSMTAGIANEIFMIIFQYFVNWLPVQRWTLKQKNSNSLNFKTKRAKTCYIDY